MYNPGLKSRFIVDITESIKYRLAYETLFNATELYEESSGCDLCAMSKDDVTSVFGNVGGIQNNSRKKRLMMMRSYCNWCLTHGVNGATDNILSIKQDDDVEKQIRTNMVANPKQLQMYLNNIFRSPQEGTVDNIYRCVVWLSFMGVEKKNIPLIRVEDVDLINLVVKYGDQTYPIYRESISEFRSCKLSNIVKQTSPKTGICSLSKVESNYLLRSAKYETINMASFSALYSKIISEFESRIDPPQKIAIRMAFLSGAYYRIYTDEVCGIPPDFSFLVDKHSGNKVLKKTAMEYERATKADYNRWKNVFYK